MHSWFVKVAAIYLFIGCLVGIWMSINQSFNLSAFHTHWNLLGWVTMAIYGIVYRIYPKANESKLVPWHFWIANLGFLVMSLGLYNVLSNHPGWEPVIAVGANGVILGVLLFILNIFTNVTKD